MSVRVDCRHYSSRSLPTGDRIERCRLDAATSMPFACPDDCLFYEARPLDDTGWKRPRGDQR
ncbi:MAG TPA: hypothetical protein VHS52_03655 [Acidimicrobiales bacterium]|jgi:hypothetical protein|nr:hypothetical protein [Acidimicrobiales bacterium]